MRIKLTFSSTNGSKISIPVRYNYYFQSLIYNLTREEKIHDAGYGKRNYKLFTFSRPFGKFSFDKKQNRLIFEKTVSWIISSYVDTFIETLSINMIKKDKIIVQKQPLELKGFEIINNKYSEITSPIKIKTLSPIVIYTTLYTADNKRKTYFYTPYEKNNFSQKIKENLIRKYKSFYKKEPDDTTFNIEYFGRGKEIITYYKTTLLKGWMGNFYIRGTKKLIELAFESGIGSRNSQGFGCIEEI